MQRLKKESIIKEIFNFVSIKYFEIAHESPSEIFIPLDEFIECLRLQSGVHYQSKTHLVNQIKTYEKERSVHLFNKVDLNGIFLCLEEFSTFKQRLYLHNNLKLMLVDGTLDLLQQLKNKLPLHIYVGNGTECFYLAKKIFETFKEEIHIYTHNISVIHLYCEFNFSSNNITLHTRRGTIDYLSSSIYDSSEDFFLNKNFDAVIQSPSYIIENYCYVVSSFEKSLKTTIAKDSSGIKIMLLTLLEFLSPFESEKDSLQAYSTVEEYNYIVTPPKSVLPKLHESYINYLNIQPFITYFSYNIYKVM